MINAGNLDGIQDLELGATRQDNTGVPDLAAGFSVKRRPFQKQYGFPALLEFVHLLTINEDRIDEHINGFQFVITTELRGLEIPDRIG